MEKLRLKEFDIVQFTKSARTIKLFASMQMDLLEKILAWVSLRRYQKGERICRQGEIGDTFFVVYEGRLSVSVRKWGLFSKQVSLLGPGDCFGEMALLRQVPRNASVTCLEETKVFVLRAEDFHDALKGNAAFAQEITKLAVERDLDSKYV